jgi:hypothetical protein
MMRKMLYWANVLIGLWIAASPWVLNFRTVENAFYSSLISGLAVAAVAFAGWLAEENVLKTGGHRSEGAGHLKAA